MTPKKSASPMPTMVASCPFTRSERPTARGSESRRVRQKRSLITTTGASPGLSRSGLSTRPCAAWMPSTEKYSGDTRCPETRAAFSPSEHSAEDGRDKSGSAGEEINPVAIAFEIPSKSRRLKYL